jgi:peptidoglycan/xylan/chitin deacetylase (PgdA/CDA1 family)
VTDVALTFDDGPSPETTPKLLETLERAGAKATFFLTGIRLAAHPGLAAEIVAAGHAVYAHGWDHENLEQAGPERAIAAMLRAEEQLSLLRPTPACYLIRLPYNAGYNRSWMHRAMARFHPDARFAWWSLSTRDYQLADGCRNREELEARCRIVAQRLGQAASLPGSFVLLHEYPFGAPGGELVPQTVLALVPPILDAIAARRLRAGPIRTAGWGHPFGRFLFLNFGGDEPLWRPEAGDGTAPHAIVHGQTGLARSGACRTVDDQTARHSVLSETS